MHQTTTLPADQAPAGRSEGFILLSALVFLALSLVIVSSQATTLLDEWRAAGREERSLRALSAADAAMACIGFYHDEKNAFDTRKPEATYDCGVGLFTAGGVNVGAEQCKDEHIYQFRLAGFANDACADVSVTTRASSFWAGPELVHVCDIAVEARGRNTCAPNAAGLVERVRTAGF